MGDSKWRAVIGLGVAGDFAGEGGSFFFHFCFDEAVAGFAHYWLCASIFHVVNYCLGHFYVEDYFWVFLAGEEVAG